jgi:hypothetical protein
VDAPAPEADLGWAVALSGEWLLADDSGGPVPGEGRPDP